MWSFFLVLEYFNDLDHDNRNNRLVTGMHRCCCYVLLCEDNSGDWYMVLVTPPSTGEGGHVCVKRWTVMFQGVLQIWNSNFEFCVRVCGCLKLMFRDFVSPWSRIGRTCIAAWLWGMGYVTSEVEKRMYSERMNGNGNGDSGTIMVIGLKRRITTKCRSVYSVARSVPGVT